VGTATPYGYRGEPPVPLAPKGAGANALRQMPGCRENALVLQRGEPPFGNARRLRRETLLQRWIHRNALAPLPRALVSPPTRVAPKSKIRLEKL
jgi:hypothetical protein